MNQQLQVTDDQTALILRMCGYMTDHSSVKTMCLLCCALYEVGLYNDVPLEQLVNDVTMILKGIKPNDARRVLRSKAQ